ncbi:hypothetical protein IAR55_007139 [Kwoniella newhampshirensis]|uniref:Dystroglycan-type cadherin-like domain-containing protein n=1 Tax=Kwoniella newhampshirensis TaxID=1651941 RepID=A0AAW0YD65_9TREE
MSSVSRLAVFPFLLSAIVQARKYDRTNGDDRPYPDTQEGTSQYPVVDWLIPSSGASIQAGQSLTATWRSDLPVYSPSFALCTGTQTTDCGKESWPGVKDNGDGTFSTTLTMPVIAESEMSDFFLTMTDDDGVSSTSPGFRVAEATGPGNAYIAAGGISATATATATISPSGQDLFSTLSTTSGQVSITSTRTTSSPTATTEGVRVMTGTYDSQSFYLTPSVQVGQAQRPLQPTQISYPYPFPTAGPSALQAQGQAQAQADAASTTPAGTTAHHSSKPTVIAIALPLAFCGLILIAALIFCARTKAFRNSGLGKNRQGDEEGGLRDWQEIVKEKAAASAFASKPVAGTSIGVEVKERKEEGNPYRGHTDTTLQSRWNSYHTDSTRHREGERDRDSTRNGHGSRCLTPLSSRQQGEQIRVRETEREYFTSLPPGIKYDRHHSHSSHSSSRRSRRSSISREDRDRSSRYRPERSGRRCEDVDPFSQGRKYFSTSRRSSSGLGGVYDSYDHGNRMKSSSGYGYGYDYPSSDLKTTDDRKRAEVDQRCSSRKGQGQDRYSHRMRNQDLAPSARERISRPNPIQADSFGPLSNPHDPFPPPPPCSSGTETGLHPSRRRRPLPNPNDNSGIAGTKDPSVSPYHSYVQGGPGKDLPPHISGGMKDDIEDLDWEREAQRERDMDLMGEGRYRSGEEGMDELYESLRIAIGRS